jgi:Protein of unknown function (DUF3300)
MALLTRDLSPPFSCRAIRLLLTLLAISMVGQPCGQRTVDAQTLPGAPAQPQAGRLSAPELEQLVGQIALYPDDLLAILLPASTFPLDIVKAQRFLEKRKSDANLQPDSSLPEPIRNLLNYPDVVKSMSDDLDWTQRLGDSVKSQQKDVLDAIQVFRRKTYTAGNLKSDDKQIVVIEKEVIKVVPSNPQVIYVPQYQPTVVVVQQAVPAVAYYPTPYPVYYYPYPPGATFATGFFAGAATAYAFSWTSHAIHYGVNARELQEERYEYARDLQEDRQNYATEAREDWQQYGSERQTQRQDAAQQRQTQRQTWGSEAQTAQARQRATARPGDPSSFQSGQTAAAAQQAAARSSGQASARSPGQFSGGGGQPTGASPSNVQGGAGNAFSGLGSGAGADRASQRGFQSARGAGGARASGGGRRR